MILEHDVDDRFVRAIEGQGRQRHPEADAAVAPQRRSQRWSDEVLRHVVYDLCRRSIEYYFGRCRLLSKVRVLLAASPDGEQASSMLEDECRWGIFQICLRGWQRFDK